jgi:hypothetical protein
MRPLAAALAASLLLAAPLRAEPDACRGAIVRAAAKHAQVALKLVRKCRDRVHAGALPPSVDCRAEPRLAAAGARLAAAVAAACCGADGACATGDDDALAAIGWDVGQCPDLEHLGCTDPVLHPGDVSACLACTGTAAADRLGALIFEPLAPSAAGSPLRRCQTSLGKETARVFRSSSKALARCWDARNRGLHANPCPDPGDGRAVGALAAAGAATAARLCAACGGTDGLCGGGDDLLPATVGSVPHCPPLTVPGGASCAAPIATLADLVACINCVTAFQAQCTGALAVPAFATYPAECNPPPGTCGAGVVCETGLDCPAGYGCQDNGGGTRYCVGAECTLDGDCGGGGVCRQYCTRDGCGARQCQCPGFGCFGPDELCLEDGGLACRKLCTQDSDCTDPFGLVCVNPGFGFGVCIGSTPCQ